MKYLLRLGWLCCMLLLTQTMNAQTVAATGSVTSVTCNGGHDGRIVYHIQGGPGPISYQWSNGTSGLATGSCTYAVHLNNAGPALSQFQVKVKVPLAAGMHADFSNLVFTDGTGTLIPFWLKDFPTVTDAVFWVKVPNIPTGTSTIYLSFCGAQTTSLSSGANTFEFFDNFDAGSFSQWFSVCDGIDQAGETCNAAADNTVFYSTGTSAKLSAHGSCFSAPFDGAGATLYRPVSLLTDSMVVDYNDQVAVELYGFCGGGTSASNSVQINSYAGANGQGQGQGGSCAVSTGTWGDDSSKPFLATGADTIRFTSYGGDCSNTQGWFDDVRVRKYTANPPIVTLDSTPALTLDSLTAGTYIVTLTDVNGVVSHDTFTVTQPTALSFTNHVVPVNCFGQSTGQAWVTVAGGTPGYQYVWNNAATNDTLTQLAAGTYKVTITDAHGCTVNDSLVVTQPASAVSASVSVTNVKCNTRNTGSAWVTANGGTLPYQYHWNSGFTTDTINNLAIGRYYVTVTDANGCTAGANDTVLQTPSVGILSDTVTASCINAPTGTATITVDGGTAPFHFQWSNGDTLATATALAGGTVTVLVTDSNGCSITNSYTVPLDTVNARVTAVPDTLLAGGSLALLTATGTGLANAVWSPSSTLNDSVGLSVSATPKHTTLYTVLVTSLSGCTAIDSILITVVNKPGWFAPSAFTPNGDGHNDRFNVITVGSAQLLLLRVYNRWGILVYEQQGAKPGWDGTYKSENQQAETFVYYAEILEDPDTGVKTTIKGAVELLR